MLKQKIAFATIKKPVLIRSDSSILIQKVYEICVLVIETNQKH